MYPGQIHRLNQVKRASELHQQQQSQSAYVVQQQAPVVQGTVQQQPSISNNQVLQLSIKAKKLKAADWNGKSDPYLEFYRLEQNGWTKVHSTPVQFKTLKPVWTGLSISLDALCYGDRNRPILLRCFDYDEGTDPDHLGDCQFNVQELLKSSKFKVDLKPATASLFNRPIGQLSFFNVSVSATASSNPARNPQQYQQQPQQYQQQTQQYQQQPQQYQQQPQQYQQQPQQYPKQPQQAQQYQQQPQQSQQPQRSAGVYSGIVYGAGNAQPASAVSYGAQYQAAQLGMSASQQGYANQVISPQLGYIGGQASQQGYVAQKGGYPGNQSYSSTAISQSSFTSHASPIGSSMYSSNIAPVGQPMYASNASSASCSRPPMPTDEIDNLPPPPSYEELFKK